VPTDPATAIEGKDADGGGKERGKEDGEDAVDPEILEAVEAGQAFKEIADATGGEEDLAHVDEGEKGDGTERNADLEIVENETKDASGHKIAPDFRRGDEENGDENSTARPVGPEGLGGGDHQSAREAAREVANASSDKGEECRVETAKTCDGLGHG